MMDIHDELTSDESKMARAYLRRIAGVVLCAVVLALTVVWATQAYAATFTMKAEGGDWVRLSDEPCEVSAGWLKLQKAEMFYQGKLYAACWALVGDSVLVLDEAGDISTLPIRAFRKDEPV